MKNLIRIRMTAVLFVILLCGQAVASESKNPLKGLALNDVMQFYLGSATLGHFEFNQYLFADSFQFLNGNRLDIKADKGQYLRFLKENSNVERKCNTAVEVLEETDHVSIVKVSIDFFNFKRADYVTLNRLDNRWQIIKIISFYTEWKS